MSEFTLEFQLSADEVREAQRSYCRSLIRRKRIWKISDLWRGFGSPFVVVLIAGFYIYGRVDEGALVWDSGLAIVTFLAGVFLTLAIWAAVSVQMPKLDEPSASAGILAAQVHHYDHDGLTIRSSEFTETVTWKVFSEVVDLKNYFCLKLGSGAYCIIAKSAFTCDDDLEKWRAFCDGHIAAAQA